MREVQREKADDEQQAGDRRGRGRAAVWMGRFTGTLAAIVLLLTLLGFAGHWAWWLDVLNQGKMQYLWLSLVFALILVAARAWRWLALAVIAAAINAWLVVPWFIGARPELTGNAGRGLRLIVLNVRESNEGFAPVLELLRRDRPDIVVLNEVDPAWLEQVQELGAGYEIWDTPAQGKFGVLLLSRHPLDKVETEKFTGRWSPSLVAQFDVEGRRAMLVATHPPAPLSAQTWENRNEHFRELQRYLEDVTDPVLVAGDLNMTMWTPQFNQLIERTRLSSTRDGYGVEPTFPASRWGLDIPWPLRVPLDHVLASSEWTVLGCRTGPNVGSDHLPLIVDLKLRPSE